ncbi:MAG TPA: Ig-like domain-containing protein, partial [Ramlibacter sp.]
AHGTVTIVDAAAGTVLYTPAANFHGTDSYTYTVTSGGVTETATVTVTVTPVDDATVFGGTSTGSGNEDGGPITGTLTVADADGITAPAFSVTGSPAHGTATIHPVTGAWSYTPAADYHGADSFTVTVTDNQGNTSTRVIGLTVASVADIAPNAATVAEDGTVTTNLLANDSFESSGAAITAVSQGAHGTVTIIDAALGTVRYTPDANWHGTDTYTYSVTAGGVTETATVTVTVSPVDDATTFGGDSTGTGNEDAGAITGTLTAVDAGDGMTAPAFVVSANPAHGTASIDPATGAWIYTPAADYHGGDSFTVRVTDGNGNFATQVITLNVSAVVDIANDVATVAEDGSVVSNVLANDSFEGGTRSITAVTSGAHGTVTIVDAALGTVLYTPAPNFHGTDTYTYTVTSGGVTETATVTVTVGSVNDATVFSGNTSGLGLEDGGVISGVLGVSDADGITSPAFTVTGAAGHGTASIHPVTGAWSYTPTPDYNGPDSFTVTVTDNQGNTATRVISLSVTPVVDIAGDTVATVEDTAVVTNVLGNDTFDNAGRLITGTTNGTNGTVTVINAAAGLVRYTPDPDFWGSDSYTYTVTAGGVTETVTVIVNVAQGNNPTTFAGATSGAGTEDGAPITGTLTVTDPDGIASPNFGVTGAAAHGTATINASTGAWTYTPDADYRGSDSFTVTVTDNNGNTATQVVTVNVGSVVDIAADTDSVAEDGSVVTDLLANDSFEGAEIITAVTQGAHGTVTIIDAALGTVRYTADPNWHGTDTYTYTVTSGGVTETATVTVTVNPVNDPTTFSGATSGSGNEDGGAITGTLNAA